MPPIALTIAGFDPSSGAGITADLLTFAAHNLFGTSAITALTVQSTLGVLASHPVSPQILTATLNCLQADLPVAGVKIGMLATAGNVSAVADYLRPLLQREPHLPVVLDPVLRSTSGRALLDTAGLDRLRQDLLPLVTWVTPNLEELAVLLDRPALAREQLIEAAAALQGSTHGRELHVVVTGGHLDPPDDLLLPPSGPAVWLPGQRIDSRSTHGTGCAFSSALLSRLVLGDAPEIAVRAAKTYVATAIASAPGLGHGNGPLDHLWPLRPR